ncbi:HCNGP-like protein-domain-containing protein [Lentinula detonsa]|uniref:HCNGP-like protein-domain-containing protein n=1 Tax=Lentinula detonsa TaxID=2804962 RepID=A0AA38UXN4_9AGAR|nr:HCNGP-like protein-domain-containing protein [Lentinula detonsa]
MYSGLVAYDGESDSGDDVAHQPDAKLKSKADGGIEPRTQQKKSQIIIKRPKTSQRPKGHVSIETAQPVPTTSVTPNDDSTPTSSVVTAQTSLIPEADDVHLARIRALLRPPPIPGLSEWGIPPEVESNCDPELEAKLNQFHQLKSSSTPKHFNDTLMSNRSFRNPHLYAQLVEFVDIDERTTNFPKEIWNLEELKDGEWDAEKIGAYTPYLLLRASLNPMCDVAKYQKIRSEQQSQQSKARTHIDFATGKDNVRCFGYNANTCTNVSV